MRNFIKRNPAAVRLAVAASLAVVPILAGAPAHAQTPSPVTVDYATAVANFQREVHNAVVTNLPLIAVTVGLVVGVTWFVTTLKRSARG